MYVYISVPIRSVNEYTIKPFFCNMPILFKSPH